MLKARYQTSISVAAIASIFLSSVAQAQTAPIMAYGQKGPSGYSSSSSTAERIHVDKNRATVVEVNVGKSEMINLPQDAADIFIANPSVVSAVIKSARRLFLVGTATGTSAIYIMDAAGNRFANLDIHVTQDLAILNDVLKHTIPTGNIKTSMVGSMVVLKGEVDSPLDAVKAVEMANAFLRNTGGGGAAGAAAAAAAPPIPGATPAAAGGTGTQVINSLTIRGKEQVMLRVTIAEVNRNVLKQLGIQTNGKWTVGQNILDFTNPAAGLFNTLAQNSIAANNASRGVDANGAPRNTRSGTFTAMEQNGLAKLLAEPTISAISGESAKLEVGGEVPVPSPNSNTSGSGNSAPTVEFKQFGINLEFTPVVLSQGRISLKVKTSVSDIDQSIGINIPTSDTQSVLVPGFRSRSSETTVELPSGGSLMTAGLIQQNSRTSLGGIPGVSSLPVIGALARSRDYTRQESELMITITPYLAKSVNAKDLAKPDDGLRDASDVAGVAFGQINAVNANRRAKPQAPSPLSGAGFILK